MAGPDDPSSRSAQLTYRDAGVDIEAGAEAVSRIKKLVAGTRRPEQLGDLGGFAGAMGLPPGLQDPVLVSCTDGVGTKLQVAIQMDRHDTVGIDLVAMCVNDLIVTGAEPLFLLDYIATGKVLPATIESIVAGIVDGCKQSGCSLLGGEIAEHPVLHEDGHYDLAAFAVGVVERGRMLTPEHVKEGDVVLALPSSGLHSNGYSLARRALLDPAHAGLDLDDRLPGSEASVGEALLEPTRIYVKALAALRDLDGAPLHGAAHVTGGGLIENPPRAVTDSLAVELDLRAVKRPAILERVAAAGVTESEMRRTFNCGIGMLLYVDPEGADACRHALEASGEHPLTVGRVVPRSGDAVRFVE
jgi:phosphoribosylformylglycinamidine cyclo-ligase